MQQHRVSPEIIVLCATLTRYRKTSFFGKNIHNQNGGENKEKKNANEFRKKTTQRKERKIQQERVCMYIWQRVQRYTRKRCQE